MRQIMGRAWKSTKPARIRAVGREFATEPLLLGQESLLLVIVSILDILMTYALLRQGFQFYESNPVARWWFERWNMAGMTVFKFLMIGVGIVSCEVIERRRPGVGRGVISLGILAAFAVVAYSILLLVRHVGGTLG